MRLLTAYYPLATAEHSPEEVVAVEVEHYIEVARVKLNRKPRGTGRPQAVSEMEITQLRDDVRFYLSEAFKGTRVVGSQWRGGTRSDALFALWDSDSAEVKGWRERLRDAHESHHYCPMCGLYRNPSAGEGRLAVDHYLPRSDWPELSIVATNLLPVCDTCNSRLKVADAPEDGGVRVYLHPYFDLFIEGLTLFAEVSFDEGILEMKFRLCNLPADAEQAKICNSHFSGLNLDARYKLKVLTEVVPSLRKLIAVKVKKGRIDTPQRCREELEDHRDAALEGFGPLHWKTAAFEAMANSMEFAVWLFEQAKLTGDDY